MSKTIPLASHEVRWFFEGKTDQHKSLKNWFETTIPENINKNPDAGLPEWKPRLNNQPDIYLLIPGSCDMGIKWREGQLQIKGLVSSHGTQLFSGRHQGNVERWIKWSYAKVPSCYQKLFLPNKENGLITVSVHKHRALRKVQLHTLTGEAREVDAGTFIDRGLVIELTDLEVAGRPYCSLAFEAFPNDTAIDTAFTKTVEAFVEGLTIINLGTSHSQSYPEFLGSVI